MNNSETTAKLATALNDLIKAYEILQKDNEALNRNIEELEIEKESLELEVARLEEEVDGLTNNQERQDSDINDMLGQIELLLNESGSEENASLVDTTSLNIDNTPSQTKGSDELELSSINEEDLQDIESPNSDDSVSEDNLSNNDDDAKIDLNRMASLLNGFK